jgi:hypothetical protein
MHGCHVSTDHEYTSLDIWTRTAASTAGGDGVQAGRGGNPGCWGGRRPAPTRGRRGSGSPQLDLGDRYISQFCRVVTGE